MRTTLVVAAALALALSGCLDAPRPAAALEDPNDTFVPNTAPPASASVPIGNAASSEADGTTPASQDHEGSWLIASGSPQGCYGNVIIVPPLAIGEGVWFDRVDVDPRTWDSPFIAHFSSQPGAPVGLLGQLPGVTFLDADGATVWWGTGPPWSGPSGVAEGVVPRGSVAGIFWYCEAIGPMTVTYHAGWDA